MGYTLGIDLGTTFTAAAVFRDGRAEVVPLGNHAATIPSLVFLREDETVVIGDAADRRGQQEPARLAREFKRRFGDSTPILLDRTPFSAERLMALMLRQILADIVARQGSQPEAIGVAHPANWGQFKIDLLRQAVQMSGSAGAAFVTEPIAAAIQYASSERVDVGEVVAVYDLGGGTFDAAVLRKTATGFETLGQPQGIERLGGIDFDEAVFAHVRRSIGDAIERLDTSDPSTRSALARLRQECVAAKETLSSDSDATIPVLLPNVQTQVRLTRSEFEDMIRPTLRETVETLKRAISISGVPVTGVKAVLLAGGSARIPLIAELVRGEFNLPVVTDLHPKHAVALGAARIAAQTLDPASGAVAPPASGRAPAPPPPPIAVPAAPAVAGAALAAGAAGAPIAAGVPTVPGAPSGGPPPPPAHHGHAGHPQQPPNAPPPAAAVALVPGGPPPGGVGGPFVPGGQGAPTAPVWKKPWFLALVALVVIGGVVGIAIAVSGGTSKSATTTTTVATTIASTTPQVTTPVQTPTTVPVTTAPTTATTAAATTTTDAATTTTVPPQVCGASGLCAGITSIVFTADKKFVVTYAVTGFVPSIPGKNHVHFFYNTVKAADAGMPGKGPWDIWDLEAGGGKLVFTDFDSTNFTKFNALGATAICVGVANHDHSIQVDTVQCMPLGFTIQ